MKKKTTSLNPLLNLAFVCFSCGVALFVVFSPQQHAAAAHGPRTLGGGETGVVFGIQSGGFQTAPACPGPTQTLTGAVGVALGARLGRFRAKVGCQLRPRRDRAAGLCSSLFSRWRMYACGLGLTTYIFGSLRAAHPGPFRNTQHTGLLNRRPGLSGVAVRRASASRRSPTAAFEDRSRGPRLRLSPPLLRVQTMANDAQDAGPYGGFGRGGRSMFDRIRAHTVPECVHNPSGDGAPPSSDCSAASGAGKWPGFRCSIQASSVSPRHRDVHGRPLVSVRRNRADDMTADRIRVVLFCAGADPLGSPRILNTAGAAEGNASTKPKPHGPRDGGGAVAARAARCWDRGHARASWAGPGPSPWAPPGRA